MKTKLAIALTILSTFGCGKEPQRATAPAPASAPAPAQSKQPNAMEIAKALKDGGIPFLKNPPDLKGVTYPLDSSPGTSGSLLEVNNPAGILSVATTATANADVDITVFSSREKLQEARQRVEAMDHRTQHDKDLKLGSNVYYIDEGCIWVSLSPDMGTVNVPGEGKFYTAKPSKTLDRYAETIKKILKEKYGNL